MSTRLAEKLLEMLSPETRWLVEAEIERGGRSSDIRQIRDEPMNLTRQEIEALIDSLDAWERESAPSELVESQVAMLMEITVPPEQVAQAKADFAKVLNTRKQNHRTRKERSIMLKAKLLGMRDGLEADSFLNAASEGK